MTESSTTTKKRPDYIAYAAIERSGQPPKFARIGVGFTYKNGSIGLLYDAIPLSGQLIVVGIDDALPATVSYGSPTTAPAYEANLVRENGKDSFWTTVGSAYHQEGYISLICPATASGHRHHPFQPWSQQQPQAVSQQIHPGLA